MHRHYEIIIHPSKKQKVNCITLKNVVRALIARLGQQPPVN